MRLFLILIFYYSLFFTCTDTRRRNQKSWSERFKLNKLREEMKIPFSVLENMPNIHLLLQEQSTDIKPKIVGGVTTTIQEFPFMASLKVNGYHTCGGSIVATTWVLTAAHCVNYQGTKANYLKKVTLMLGSTYLNSTNAIKPTDVIKHELYNSNTFDYDAALFKLGTPLIYSENIAKINMADSSVTIPMDGTATALGWGTTSEGGSISNQLMKVDVPFVSEAICKAAYGINAITPRMLCAGQEDKDTCQGDSGGPLTIMYNGERWVVGLTSWGNGCARPDYPGVYSNVKVLYTWIIGKINGVPSTVTTRKPTTTRRWHG